MIRIKPRFTALILAGGSSTRMGGRSKQQISLSGIPVAARSMLAFENAPSCEAIIVVAKEEELPLYAVLAQRYGVSKFQKAVKGGKTRQESAFAGMESLADEVRYLAIHDAARCLVTPEMIEKVFAAAVKEKAASACCPATDTVKIAEHGKTRTKLQPERSKLIYMQTPQIFLADLYRAAAYSAREDGFCATDDCSLVERAGFGCALVNTGSENRKITEPVDVAIAEAILRYREEIEEAACKAGKENV